MRQKAINKFNALEQYKNWCQTELPKHCKETYGEEIYATYISGCIDDMLFSLECLLEEIGEKAVIEEEYDYDEESDNEEENEYPNDPYEAEFGE